MSIYSNDRMEEIIKQIFLSLSSNETFLRLMSNDDPSGLDNASTKTLGELYPDRLIPLRKILDPTREQGSYIMIYFDRAIPAGTNDIYKSTLYYNIKIMCHKDICIMTPDSNDNWRFRHYRLLDVIKEELETLKSNIPIRGELNVDEPRSILDLFYDGFEFSFDITGFTNKINC